MDEEQRFIEYEHGESFSQVFPIYYRAVGLFIFGMWCWGINVKFLSRYGIDVLKLFHSRKKSSILVFEEDRLKTHIRNLFKLSLFFTMIYFGDLLAFLWHIHVPSIFLPSILYFLLLIVLLVPFKFLFYKERLSFLATIYSSISCIFSRNITLKDILISDILTSYSKVLSDIGITFCSIALSARTDYHFHSYLHSGCVYSSLPLLLSILPFFIRLAQTLQKKELGNSLKYFSSIVVIVLSAIQKWRIYNFDVINKFWLSSCFFNSLFSFYWDIQFDWDLGHWNSKHFLLRDHLQYQSPLLYYCAILSNFLLRFTWSIKLSSHLYPKIEFSLFIFEVLEILRRTTWIFFRMEAEHLKIKKRESKSHSLVQYY